MGREEAYVLHNAEGYSASACVFDLLESTTTALIVQRLPPDTLVKTRIAKHKEALVRSKVLTMRDPTVVDLDEGSEDEDLCEELPNRRAALECHAEIKAFEHRLEDKEDCGIHALSWSPEAKGMVEDFGREKITPSEACGYFTVLRLLEQGITTIDASFQCFTSLQRLHLCRNSLTELQYLPSGLRALAVSANYLEGHALDHVPELPQLSLLDLSYNNISTLFSSVQELPGFGRRFPALEHLDLSWNALCNLGDVMRALGPLAGTLKHLFLMGNPLVMLPRYRERILLALGSQLRVLDDVAVTAEERKLARSASDLQGHLRGLDAVFLRVHVTSMRGLPEVMHLFPSDTPEPPAKGKGQAKEAPHAEAAGTPEVLEWCELKLGNSLPGLQGRPLGRWKWGQALDMSPGEGYTQEALAPSVRYAM
ncbi:unnamed protein product [Chrysoparadoxa australica]